MYQPSSIELYSMIIINSPIKLETEKGAQESLKQVCAASGQLIHRVNYTRAAEEQHHKFKAITRTFVRIHILKNREDRLVNNLFYFSACKS